MKRERMRMSKTLDQLNVGRLGLALKIDQCDDDIKLLVSMALGLSSDTGKQATSTHASLVAPRPLESAVLFFLFAVVAQVARTLF